MTPTTLREARERIGWSAREAAARSGWSEASIRDYEAGRRAPAPEYTRYIEAVARAVERVPTPRAKKEAA